MREKLRRWMQGRYGMDEFGNFLVWTTLVLMIVNLFAGVWVIYWIAIALLFFSYSRVLSRNYARCSAQNRWYLNRTRKIRELFSKASSRRMMRRQYHIYTCKQCRQKIRIPKGKGKIIVTCPKCKHEFVKKS